MIKVGDIVRYAPQWCTEGERHLLHLVKERLLNPCTNTETRFLIVTLNGGSYCGGLLPNEVVDDFMLEETGLTIEEAMKEGR